MGKGKKPFLLLWGAITIIAGVVALYVFLQQPKNVDDCILKGMEGVVSDRAASFIRNACENKFRKPSNFIDLSNLKGNPFGDPLAEEKVPTPQKNFFDDTQKLDDALRGNAPTPVSAVSEGGTRFEFYKVLTDKPDAMLPGQKGSAGSLSPESKLAPAPTKAAQEIYFLSVGSFSSEEDAGKLKASLAMLGMEASVQIVTILDRGVVHRVRLGPYKGVVEMNKARMTLQQYGVEAAPMRAQ